MDQRQIDEHYMQQALQLARQGRGRTSPNPVVGAVIVKDDQVIGRGWHQKAGTAHAEIHALAEAGSDAKNATIYVTLEPCCHHGRTGPCTEAILAAGIQRVVVAMKIPCASCACSNCCMQRVCAYRNWWVCPHPPLVRAVNF